MLFVYTFSIVEEKLLVLYIPQCQKEEHAYIIDQRVLEKMAHGKSVFNDLFKRGEFVHTVVALKNNQLVNFPGMEIVKFQRRILTNFHVKWPKKIRYKDDVNFVKV